ncbi:hypothetical protein H7I76_08685 [Mycolicibacterium vaccae]|nr:hypothetical protein [Mycolicibacterium vaccae]
MERTVTLWVDDSNAIFRRGLADCLASSGFAIVGEGSHLLPVPDPALAEIFLLELDRAAVSAGTDFVAAGTRCVGIAEANSSALMEAAVKAGFAGLLIREEITPAGLVAVCRAVACGVGSIPPAIVAPLLGCGNSPASLVDRGVLACRELNVLRLLRVVRLGTSPASCAIRSARSRTSCTTRSPSFTVGRGPKPLP